MTLQPASHASGQRPLEVGLFLPPGETSHSAIVPTWADLLAMAHRAEEVSFNAVWLPDHLLLGFDADEPVPVLECWSLLSALAASTSRIGLGTLVSSTAYRNPAVLAKIADTVQEISGGRLLLGLGAGWNEFEFDAFGIPFGRRVSRFEEAIVIISRLLRGEQVDFEGTYHRVQCCRVRPQNSVRQSPRIVIGTRRPRMMRLAARYADTWDSDFIDNPSDLTCIREVMEEVDSACRDAGRDPATLRRSASIHVNAPGQSQPDHHWTSRPAAGSPRELADLLLAYAGEGISQVQIWLNPNTVEGVSAFAPVLDLLDGRST